LTSLLNLAVAALAIATLFFAQDVVIPIVLAVMLSFVLAPAVGLLEQLRLPRAPAVLLVIVLTFGLVGVAGSLVGTQAATLSSQAPRYAEAIGEKLQRVEFLLGSRMAGLTRLMGSAETGAAEVTSPAAAASASGPAVVSRRPQDAAALAATAAAAQGRPVLVEIAHPDGSPLLTVRSILAPVLGPLETTVIVLVIAVFILLEREDLRDRFIRLAGARDLYRTTAAMDDAAQRLSRYFVSQMAVNGTFGLVIGMGLWAAGIPSPALWGVLAGLLRFVPYLGPILAAVPPLALAAAIEPGWSKTIEVGLLFALIEPFTGYVVEPLLYGHSTGLAPIAVIVAAVFWTWMWGPIGLILSTPLTLCLVVLGRHVKALEFLDVLLGDRPALAPVESLYQRILADSPDEILDKAETLLTTQSLTDYYDQVMLPSLKLAAEDQARGVLSEDQARQMTRVVLQVVEDLADHQDAPLAGATPAPATSSLTIACVAGRGPFDDAASAMLAQLLMRAGFTVTRVPHADVSRDRVSALDLSHTGVVILSYVDTTNAYTHLRYLVRRLRQRAPRARIVIGVWPQGSPKVDDAAAQMIGADLYVHSLREAIDDVTATTAHRITAPGHLADAAAS
jgi:predicted PurR-regulated permease PerM/methanogenic corrinoid protein MtbC1